MIPTVARFKGKYRYLKPKGFKFWIDGSCRRHYSLSMEMCQTIAVIQKFGGYFIEYSLNHETTAILFSEILNYSFFEKWENSICKSANPKNPYYLSYLDREEKRFIPFRTEEHDKITDMRYDHKFPIEKRIELDHRYLTFSFSLESVEKVMEWNKMGWIKLDFDPFFSQKYLD